MPRGGVRPVLRLRFRGPNANDGWVMDGDALTLDLKYVPQDQTLTWGETTGSVKALVASRRFKPCKKPLGALSWPQKSTWQVRDIELCPQ